MNHELECPRIAASDNNKSRNMLRARLSRNHSIVSAQESPRTRAHGTQSGLKPATACKPHTRPSTGIRRYLARTASHPQDRVFQPTVIQRCFRIQQHFRLGRRWISAGCDIKQPHASFLWLRVGSAERQATAGSRRR